MTKRFVEHIAKQILWTFVSVTRKSTNDSLKKNVNRNMFIKLKCTYSFEVFPSINNYLQSQRSFIPWVK